MTDLLRTETARRRSMRSWLAFGAAGSEAMVGRHQPDDTLVVLLMCCRPSLTRTSAFALTLRAVGGLTSRYRGAGLLARMSDNPMVALNQAIATAMGQGPAAGLAPKLSRTTSMWHAARRACPGVTMLHAPARRL